MYVLLITYIICFEGSIYDRCCTQYVRTYSNNDNSNSNSHNNSSINDNDTNTTTNNNNDNNNDDDKIPGSRVRGTKDSKFVSKTSRNHLLICVYVYIYIYIYM